MPPFERPYVAAYCAAKWPEGGYVLGYPLGPIPAQVVREMGYEAGATFYRPWRPEVDAVHFSDAGLILLEGKVFRVLDALAKLRWYGELVANTEELRPWWGKDVQLRLVTVRVTNIVLELAKASGVVIDVYQTPEAVAKAEWYERYWTREYQLAKQVRDQRRRELGLD